MIRRILLVLLSLGALLGVVGWVGRRVYDDLRPQGDAAVPATTVKRGDVTFSVNARGVLQGGSTKMLAAPMTGSAQLILTSLRKPGELVQEGEVIAEFDTTEESFKQREAEADLAEAEQMVLQAQNEAKARDEELNYELIAARAEVKTTQIETERNELLAAIVARQNNIALESATERLAKLERDYPQRKAAAGATIAIHEAARRKASMLSDTARRNIGLMVLKAPMGGYVNVERNTNSNFFFPGMQFPLLQVGDPVRPGMGVAHIPDMKTWEVTAQIAEADRGHLKLGQEAEIRIVAIPGEVLKGQISDLGSTTGPPWDRKFECKLSLREGRKELRPGMSARIIVTTDTLRGTLWLPAQALFESDSRKYVYLSTNAGYVTKDVQLVRRGESQVVITGINEGDLVALANPAQSQSSKDAAGGGATKALSK